MLDDWRTAPVGEPLRSALGLVEQVTLSPGEVGPADVQAVRDAGASEDQIVDALHVCALFNMIDRLADAFGWHVQSPEAFAKDATFLLKRGYGLIGPVERRALAR